MFYCTVLLRSCNVLKLQLPHRLLVGVTDFEMASALQTQHLFAGDVRTDGKMGSASAEAQYGLYGGDNLCAILCFLSAFCGMRGFQGFRATRDAMARVSLHRHLRRCLLRQLCRASVSFLSYCTQGCSNSVGDGLINNCTV